MYFYLVLADSLLPKALIFIRLRTMKGELQIIGTSLFILIRDREIRKVSNICWVQSTATLAK